MYLLNQKLFEDVGGVTLPPPQPLPVLSYLPAIYTPPSLAIYKMRKVRAVGGGGKRSVCELSLSHILECMAHLSTQLITVSIRIKGWWQSMTTKTCLQYLFLFHIEI